MNRLNITHEVNTSNIFKSFMIFMVKINDIFWNQHPSGAHLAGVGMFFQLNDFTLCSPCLCGELRFLVSRQKQLRYGNRV